VAVIEQFQNPRNKIFYRKVDRIYTPGTWNGEEEDEQSRTNNYLLSIASNTSSAIKANDIEKLSTESSDKEELAMAWVDLSTGDFWVGTTKLKDFHYELARLRPKEIVLSKKLESKASLVNTFDSWPSIITYEPDSTYGKYKYDDSLKYLRKQLAQFSPLENRAGIGLLNYVEKTQGGRPLDLTLPLKGDSEHRMRVNLTTMRSLELFETQLSDASKLSPNSLRNTRVTAQNSLFHLLDQCQTRGGSRLLAERLIAPSTDLEEINDRLDLIEFFVQNPHLLSQIQQLFKGIKDPPRLLQRISMGQSHPRDLVDLQTCLTLFNSIKEILSNFVDNKNTPKSVRALFDQIEEFDKLQDMINTTIKPPPYSLEEATSELANSHSWINPNFNEELVKLISERVVLDESKGVMEQELKAFSGNLMKS
jgi:DNA mismatch repair protein MutS